MFKVLKPFRDVDGSFKMVGDSVELNDERAGKLRRCGMIGNTVNKTIESAEKALKKSVENAMTKEKEVRKNGTQSNNKANG